MAAPRVESLLTNVSGIPRGLLSLSLLVAPRTNRAAGQRGQYPVESQSECVAMGRSLAILLRWRQVVFDREGIRIVYPSPSAVWRSPEGHLMQSGMGTCLRGERLPKRAALHGICKVKGLCDSI